MRRSLLSLAALLALTACAEETHPPHFLSKSQVMPASLPFSESVRVGDIVYLSGLIGNVPGKLELVPGGMPAEAKQVLDNLRAVLASNGLAMRDVVKCTVMLADMTEWSAFNDIYREAFAPPYPARSALGANGLALGARVELECIAAAHGRPRPKVDPTGA